MSCSAVLGHPWCLFPECPSSLNHTGGRRRAHTHNLSVVESASERGRIYNTRLFFSLRQTTPSGLWPRGFKSNRPLFPTTNLNTCVLCCIEVKRTGLPEFSHGCWVVGESGVRWAVLYIQHHSIKGNIVFFPTKTSTYCIFRMRVPVNNENSCKHYKFENIAHPK